MSTAPGQVLGRAGGSLSNSSSWLGNSGTASVGRAGEESTARVLLDAARRPGGPTVLHDLRIPIPGISANIDHIVVSGRTVTVIDSKQWKPGFYWTLFGSTRRGSEAFAPADKKTVPMAEGAVDAMLTKAGIRHRMGTSRIVVWPSSRHSALTLRFYRPKGARAVTGPEFTNLASRWYANAADPAIVAALRSLTIKS